ncbi:MAG TPA: Uma2 family endonuclease [Planctomycetota bacterium]|nr:Uma2 family endonuclease [Planctomycetota bacterium]
MSSPTITTAEELLSLREPGVRHELVHGELRRMSPAGSLHGVVVGRLATFLGGHVYERHLGETFGAETGFVLTRNPDTVRAPDVAFVERARLPREYPIGYFPGPPDLAVEVHSPGDTSGEVQAKVRFWLEHGVRSVWVVDPNARRVSVHRGAQGPNVLGIDDVLDGDDVLPGFAVPVRTLFPVPAAS